MTVPAAPISLLPIDLFNLNRNIGLLNGPGSLGIALGLCR
jgi:hypothetical protein